MGEGDTLLNAAIGAVLAVLLSFTGVSPIVGGAVAGYLQREGPRRGATVGALSGALAFLPFLLAVVLFAALVGLGPVRDGVPGGVELVLVFLFVVVPLVLLWSAGLGAIGGYLGAYVREEAAA